MSFNNENQAESAARLAPITGHQSLQESTYQTLRAAILNGDFKIGARLYEAELARQLGISRNPVREAIRRLQQDGLIEVRPRNGIFITSLSNDQVDDLYRIRGALEGVAARLAAERMTDADREDLRALLGWEPSGTESAEPDSAHLAMMNKSDRIHRAIHNYAKSQRLLDMLELLYSQVQTHRNVTLRLPGRSDVAGREHLAIAQTILNRDSLGAEALMREHIEGARVAIIANRSIHHKPD